MKSVEKYNVQSVPVVPEGFRLDSSSGRMVVNTCACRPAAMPGFDSLETKQEVASGGHLNQLSSHIITLRHPDSYPKEEGIRKRCEAFIESMSTQFYQGIRSDQKRDMINAYIQYNIAVKELSLFCKELNAFREKCNIDGKNPLKAELSDLKRTVSIIDTVMQLISNIDDEEEGVSYEQLANADIQKDFLQCVTKEEKKLVLNNHFENVLASLAIGDDISEWMAGYAQYIAKDCKLNNVQTEIISLFIPKLCSHSQIVFNENLKTAIKNLFLNLLNSKTASRQIWLPAFKDEMKNIRNTCGPESKKLVDDTNMKIALLDEGSEEPNVAEYRPALKRSRKDEFLYSEFKKCFV